MTTFNGTNNAEVLINVDSVEQEDDIILGGGGNDTIYSGLKDSNNTGPVDLSNDYIDGGDGYDTLIYRNPFSNSDPDFSAYTVDYPINAFFSADGTLSAVTKGVASTMFGISTDYLVDIERLVAPNPADRDTNAYSFSNQIDASTTAVNINFNMSTGNSTINGKTYKLDNFVDVFGGFGNDSITGNNFNNTIRTNGGNDTIRGGNGDDSLFGEANNDYLVGGNAGTNGDSLTGGDGNDTLAGGGTGKKFMSGGSGTDIFAIGNGQGVAIITDFTTGQSDQIGLVGLAFGSITQSVDAFDFLNIFNGTTALALLTNQNAPLDSSNFISNYNLPA
jgi:Ca2+-binding RTX toxin-like protein